ncbi:translation initiation factor IF-2 [Candidatus Peregrinibacteria bacterium]|nr:translation initiation factor IF-2 [Candidatus Peregrinibacteria bacterium]
MSMKIADLAKKLGVTAADLRKKIIASGHELKPRATTIDDEIAQKLEAEFQKKEAAAPEELKSEPQTKPAPKITPKAAPKIEETHTEAVGATEVYAEIYDKTLDREIIKAQRKMTAGKDIRPKKPGRAAGPRISAPISPAVTAAGVIEIPEVITVKEFAEKTAIPAAKIIGELMKNGILANINQQLDYETCQIIADDMKLQLKKRRTAVSISDMMTGNLDALLGEDEKADLKPRPPIVVVMGHVDHGKCVAGDTLIPCANGEILSAETLWKIASIKNTPRLLDNLEECIEYSKQAPLLFSLEEEKIVKRKPSHIFRLKSSETIKITLQSGDSVEVTPEHPFPEITSEGDLIWTKASNLKKGNFVVIPKYLPFSNSWNAVKKNIWERLTTADNWKIFVDREIGNEFLQKLKCLKNKRKLITTSIYDAIKHSRFRSKDFRLLIEYFHIPWERALEMIKNVKSSTEKWRAGHTSPPIKLPKNKNELMAMAYTAGCLAGDGYMKYCYFYNADKDVQKAYQKAVYKAFGVTAHVDMRYIDAKHTCPKITHAGGKSFIRFFTDILGMPVKNKCGSINVPRIILLHTQLRRLFIAGWIDTDGTVSKCNYSIEITSKSKLIVEEIGTFLLEFGIHSTIAQKKGYFMLRIANDPYLKRFLKYIPLSHTGKQNLIKKALSKATTSRIFDITPISGKILKNVALSDGLISYFSIYRKYKHLSRPFLEKFLNISHNNFAKLFKGKFAWHFVNPGMVSCTAIKFIKKYQSERWVYDFTIPRSHTFAASRMVVHNTKLLDHIRKTKVAEGEAGGITQKIGAYQVELKGKKITFLDTPGHEAFTAMRARGAKVTDIAILVIAADEGIKPQTIEAINHAKEADVPIIVALNKIDKPDANIDKVKGELTEYQLVSEEWGGKTIMVPVSAITGQGVDTLLEMILLVADMENLKANPNRAAVGTVIEAHLDKNMGPVATIIVNTGTLRIGDNIVVGPVHGKIKAMKDFNGKNVNLAPPSMPVFIAGLSATVQAGDIIHVVEDEKAARGHASQIHALRASEERKGGLGSIINQIQSGALKVLKIVLKADSKGSLDALRDSLAKIHHEEVALKVIHSGIGNITEGDVVMASASNGIVIGFNTIVSQHVKSVASRHGVEIATYNIIYKLLEDIQGILSGMLEPEIVETILGQAQILQIFYHKKQTTIIGCRVKQGIIKNKAHLRVIRNGAVIGTGEIQSLKKSTEAVNELNEGNECGIKYFGDVELAEGDILEAFITERRKKEFKTT